MSAALPGDVGGNKNRLRGRALPFPPREHGGATCDIKDLNQRLVGIPFLV